MKYLKKFNENSIRLAADIYFRSKEGDWMQGINDPFTLRSCRVKFPDGAYCYFKVLKEDFNSEFLNLKIGVTDNEYTVGKSNFYLSVYGDNIQFESLNEYKFVRKYLLKEDLLDHTFDSYIYSDNHNGPFEVSVKIIEGEVFDYGRECIIGFYNDLLRHDIVNYVKKNKEWKSEVVNFFDDDSNLQRLYGSILDKIDEESIFEISPREIKIIGDLSISGGLYLFYILRGNPFKDLRLLKEILRDENSKINTNIFAKIIESLL
jgi:hypothetical protein